MATVKVRDFVVGAVLIIGGLALGLAGPGATALAAMSSSHWVPTPCLVLTSRVEESVVRGINWVPVIEFEYEHAGSSYTSDQIDLVSQSYASNLSQREAQVFVAQFPQGSRVTCFVNPANPTQAVLQRRVPWGYALGTSAVALAFVGLGLLIVVGSLRGKLEESVGEREGEGTLKLRFDPSQRPPGRGLAVHIEGDTMRLSVGPEATSLAVGGLATLFGVAVLALPAFRVELLHSVPRWAALAGLVFGASVLGWNLLVSEELLISAAEVVRQYRSPWGTFRRSSLKADAIEDVIVANNKGSQNVETVQVVSGERRISFGMTLSGNQRRWVRDCVLAVVST